MTDNFSEYSILDNVDAVDDAAAASDEATTPILKLKNPGHIYRYRLLPPSPAWAEFFNAKKLRPTPFFFYWKHLYQDPETSRWISYACPRRNPGAKRDCLDCERAFALFATGKPADRKMGKQVSASRSVVFCAIDREDEDAGPKIVELSAPYTNDPDKLKDMPLTQWQKLEKLFRIYRKDIVDPSEKGWDVTTLREGSGEQGTSYDFQTADAPCPLSLDPEQVKDWILAQPDLPRRIAVLSDDEIRRKLRLPPVGGTVSQVDPGRQLPAGPAGETAGDIIDAELAGDDDDW
jgi:hypothetical protein